MRLRSLLLASALFAAFASPGFAAGLYSTFSQPTGALTGAEDFAVDTNLPNGANPQTYAPSVQQVRARGYQQSTPLTAFAITAASNTNIVQLTPAGTLAAGAVTLPAAPVDGQTVKIFSTQIVTAFTLTPNSGQTINGTAVTALAANVGVEYVYSAASATWYRVS